MSAIVSPAEAAHEAPALSRATVLVLAAACGLVVANVYYAQPLVGPISASLGLSTAAAGLIVTMTQIGYVLGLLFLVPLGDLLENRRLMALVLVVCSAALLAAAWSTHAGQFLAAMLAIGLSSVVVQMLIPFAAHLAPEAVRGRVVGTVTSGLMIGIMMSRPISSFITHETAWPVVFELSAVAMLATAMALMRLLPRRVPVHNLTYGGLLASMLRLAAGTPVLQRRAVYQFCQYFAFSLFWTTVPLYLAAEPFGLTQAGIAWFGLAAVAGAVAAPFCGTLADRGYGRLATGLGILASSAGLLLSRVAPGSVTVHLALLTLAATLLDFGVSATLVTSQRAIFSLGAAVRSRLNGIFMASFFIGGAVGSAVGAWAFARGGWPLASAVGLALPLLGLCFYATEFRSSAASRG